MADVGETPTTFPILGSDAGRSCGGCTACCEGGLWDKSMKLSAGHACQHISANGCGIYESRPEKPCRTFRCAWLTEVDQFPDEMRPDLSGVIPVHDRDWYHWKVLRLYPRVASVPPEVLAWFVAYAKPKQEPVIFYEHHWEGDEYKGMSEKALGPPRFAEDVKLKPTESDVFRSLNND
ncbi:MAG: hypothetical protein P8O15_02400 [Luminiphilus sp.]|nr:hypothetical protein [Luminiphilus sp.]